MAISILSVTLVATAAAQESPGFEDGFDHQTGDASSSLEPLGNTDPISRDAAQLASDIGIGVEEAKAALERQPLVGSLERALEERGPEAFGGLYIDYAPKYSITLVARPGETDSVVAAVSELGFPDLTPFVVARETPYTADTLRIAMQQVEELAREKVATLDFDIRTGEILATVATPADVEAVRSAIESSPVPIAAQSVSIEVEAFSLQHSYGGLGMDSPNGDCTSGFSVRRTTDDAEGVTDAAHCPNSNVTLGHHSGTILDHIAQKEGDSQDIQWFKTPGLNDPNQIKDDPDGSTRNITSRTDRSEMPVGGSVCHFGRSSGYGCGLIASKDFDPGPGYHATFIRVDLDVTLAGDSGGPWFLSNSAYGTHVGITSGTNPDPIFMAQNYMGALNLVVKIN